MKSTTSASGGTVLTRIVARTLSFAEREGLDRATLIEGAGLQTVDLTDPDGRVPFSAQARLWEAIRAHTSDPAFGIKLGASLRARELGLLGYAISFSPTLESALCRLVRYGDLISETVRFRFVRPDELHVLVAECPLGPATIGLAMESRLAGLLSVGREITGTHLVFASLEVEYQRPASTIDQVRFFGCPIVFGASQTRLSFTPADLELPIPGGDELLAGYLSQHAETVLHTLTGDDSTASRVRSLIWSSLSEGRPTLQRAAAGLQLSPRTLQRQLSEEGTSFKEQVEEVRAQMAMAALRDPTVPIDEVAFLLGYAEPSSFYRSFRRWTGSTPHLYRRAPDVDHPTRSPATGVADPSGVARHKSGTDRHGALVDDR